MSKRQFLESAPEVLLSDLHISRRLLRKVCFPNHQCPRECAPRSSAAIAELIEKSGDRYCRIEDGIATAATVLEALIVLKQRALFRHASNGFPDDITRHVRDVGALTEQLLSIMKIASECTGVPEVEEANVAQLIGACHDVYACSWRPTCTAMPRTLVFLTTEEFSTSSSAQERKT